MIGNAGAGRAPVRCQPRVEQFDLISERHSEPIGSCPLVHLSHNRSPTSKRALLRPCAPQQAGQRIAVVVQEITVISLHGGEDWARRHAAKRGAGRFIFRRIC